MGANTLNNTKICTSGSSTELEKIRNFVLSNANTHGFNDITSNKIALAVDEACSNIIKYAYNHDVSKEICVEINHDKNDLLIRIIDDGKPFNPRKVPSPDMTQYLKEFRKGGLGIHIMRTVMDKIDYKPSVNQQKQNILELRKTLKS